VTEVAQADAKRFFEIKDGIYAESDESTGRTDNLGSGGCRNDQIVCSARRIPLANGNEQSRVGPCYFNVVADDRKRRYDLVEKQFPRRLSCAGRDLDANSELSHRDRSDGGFVVIDDQCVEIESVAFDLDQHARVEQ
jgi:hypothetical protein